MTKQYSAHTPGPWTIQHGTNIYGKRLDAGYETCIANAGSFSSNEVDTTAENQANARLIAAAPDLLDTCKLVLMLNDPPPVFSQWQSQVSADRLREVINHQLRAVIKRASCEAPEHKAGE